MKWSLSLPKTSCLALRSLRLASCILFFFCTSAGLSSSGQGLLAQGSLLDRRMPAYEILDRTRIMAGGASLDLSFSSPSTSPLERGKVFTLARAYHQGIAEELSAIDRFWLGYILTDNAHFAPPVRLGEESEGVFYLDEKTEHASYPRPYVGKRYHKTFYSNPANLWEVNRPDFYLRINPILDLRYGKMQNDVEDFYYNRRGVDLRAGIDNKIYLHFQLLETQLSLPNYLRDFRTATGGVPGAGFIKPYTFSALNVEQGTDFLQSTGYFGFQISPHVGMRFGYGSQFIGRGERSLLLSDFSNNYPFLQLNWQIWRFHYQNIFAELTNASSRTGSPGMPLPKKYLAAHHLGIQLGKRLELGIFEAVVFNREEGFEWGYLNPIILYRTIEQSLGSPDNVILGFDGSYTLPPHLELYTQFVLDEFVFDELIVQRRGWWANKFGYQIGLKYINAFGLDQLDLQAEHNTVRPYTYTHTTGLSNYTHFGMPLAHPLGANFRESILSARYRPIPRLRLEARLYLINQGEGRDSLVVGQNINLPSEDRAQDFGNEIGQGVNYNSTVLTAEASYMLKHNLFLEAVFFKRSKDSEELNRDLETTYFNLGVRWNVGRRRDFF